MPAWRLNGEGVAVRRYDVAGFDSQAELEFITHVALSEEERSTIRRANDGIAMVHMLPPFRSTVRSYRVPVIATGGLDPGKYPQIKAFIDELRLEYKAHEDREKRHPKVAAEEQYVIDPPAKGPEPETPYWRFSCAGFVLHAYEVYAGIQLVVRDQLPPITLAALKQAYPSFADRLDNPDDRNKFGLLGGKDRWPVVLAGYVINALARDVATIQKMPHKPVQGDEFFPPRPPLAAKKDGGSQIVD